MITLQELREAAYAKHWHMVAEDPYSPVEIMSLMEITDDIPQYEPMIHAMFVVEFGYSCIYREGEGETVLERMARAVHDKIYGDVIQRLYRIQQSAYTDSREQMMAKIDTLIKEIKDGDTDIRNQP